MDDIAMSNSIQIRVAITKKSWRLLKKICRSVYNIQGKYIIVYVLI